MTCSLSRCYDCGYSYDYFVWLWLLYDHDHDYDHDSRCCRLVLIVLYSCTVRTHLRGDLPSPFITTLLRNNPIYFRNREQRAGTSSKAIPPIPTIDVVWWWWCDRVTSICPLFPLFPLLLNPLLLKQIPRDRIHTVDQTLSSLFFDHLFPTKQGGSKEREVMPALLPSNLWHHHYTVLSPSPHQRSRHVEITSDIVTWKKVGLLIIYRNLTEPSQRPKRPTLLRGSKSITTHEEIDTPFQLIGKENENDSSDYSPFPPYQQSPDSRLQTPGNLHSPLHTLLLVSATTGARAEYLGTLSQL